MAETSPTLALARRFIEAIEAGDVEGARGCLDPSAGIWHNFDDKTQTVDENLALLGWMMKHADARRYEITRLEEIEGGYLQQHVLRIQTKSGREISAHACVVVSVSDGCIQRIEEYLDPSALAQLAS